MTALSRGKAQQIKEKRAVLAFGGNLPSDVGSTRETITAALASLGEAGAHIVRQSRYFETPCFPAGAGPNYVNLAVVVKTTCEAEEFLAQLHDLEAKFGRTRETRWAGRTLDIDLLSFEDLILPDLETYEYWADLPLEVQMKAAPSELILPHPRIQDRGFVLIPLCDVWPDWVHPVSGKTAQMLCDGLPASEIKGIKPL